MVRLTCVLLLAAAASIGAAEREWYEAYQEGQRALRARRHAAAIELLLESARLRPQPGRNVRTYGTNLEAEYFPYLALAEAYLGLQDAEAALDALLVADQFALEPADRRAALRARAEAQLEAARPKPTPPPEPPPTTRPPPTPETPPTTRPIATPEAMPPPTPQPAPPTTTAPPAPPPSTRAEAPAPPSASPTPTPEETGTTLFVRSAPPGASVHVDGRLLGRTDRETGGLLVEELQPGSHSLRLSLPGHEDLLQEVEIEEGRRTLARLVLTPLGTPTPPASGATADRTGDVVLGIVVLAAIAVSGWGVRLLLRPVPGLELDLAGDDVAVPVSTPRGLEHATPTPEALPQPFGEYVLLSRLGRGGMAVVYKAQRRDELVALKRPLASIAEDEQAVERFVREAAIGRTLYHPNIVRVLDAGTVEGAPYFTMELIEGETLRERLRRGGAPAPREAAWLIAQVAEALDYAHSKGVVHRDLKPSNVLLPTDGPPKVSDYGIARARRFEGLTATGAFLGSPEYVSPEVVAGGQADARSDLYALGVIFYELLTGQRPFIGETPFGVMQSHLNAVPRPPSQLASAVPRHLEDIVLRLLAKRPADRYTDAEELLVALMDYRNHPEGEGA